MIDRKIAQCNYCKTKIGLRFQMGYFDIPFDFRCPECGVRIHGIRKITADDSLNLNNARIINTDAENILIPNRCMQKLIQFYGGKKQAKRPYR